MKIWYASHLQQETGYGRAAYHLACAMIRALESRPGHELSLIEIGPDEGETKGRDLALRYPRVGNLGADDVLIVHTLPLDCVRAVQQLVPEDAERPTVIAYTTWEAMTAPPELIASLTSFDQVWVPASSVQNALSESAKDGFGGRLRVVPHCFDEEREYDTGSDDRDRQYTFVWLGAWNERKNPRGLVRAFALAFAPTDNARLILHSVNLPSVQFVEALAATGLDVRQLPQIDLSRDELNDEQVEDLITDADCYVCASRGEGWNLPAFEAMLHRRHVIAPYGHGSDDFLTSTSAELVDGMEAPAHLDATVTGSELGALSVTRVGAQGLSSRCLWSEPNLVLLAAAMRDAYEHRRRYLTVHYDPREQFGYRAVGALVLSLLLKDN